MRDIWRLKARSILIKCERLSSNSESGGVGGVNTHTHIQPCLVMFVGGTGGCVGVGLSLSLLYARVRETSFSFSFSLSA